MLQKKKKKRILQIIFNLSIYIIFLYFFSSFFSVSFSFVCFCFATHRKRRKKSIASKLFFIFFILFFLVFCVKQSLLQLFNSLLFSFLLRCLFLRFGVCSSSDLLSPFHLSRPSVLPHHSI